MDIPADVSVMSLTMSNHDPKHVGEHFADDSAYELQELLAQNFDFDSQHSQVEALNKLQNVLDLYRTRLSPHKLLHSLGKLGDKLHDLEYNTRTLKHEVKAVLGGGRDATELATHIKGLGDMIRRDGRHAENMFDSLKQTAEVKKIENEVTSAAPQSVESFHDTRKQLEDVVDSAGMLFYLSVFVMCGAGVVLLSLWQKMKNYEKKHVF